MDEPLAENDFVLDFCILCPGTRRLHFECFIVVVWGECTGIVKKTLLFIHLVKS